jgi:AraC-like DNA-binding protein
MKSSEMMLTCSYSTQQTPYERHFHNAHELVYVCAGSARFQIGNSYYEAGPHSLIFISKLEEHSVQILKGDYLRYFAQFSPAQLDRLLEDPKLKSVFISRPEGFSHCFDVSPIASEMEDLLCKMAAEVVCPQSFNQYYFAALFSQMMILCYRVRKDQFPLPIKSFGMAVYDAQKYIDCNYTKETPLELLSRRFYISPSYLSHAFREWTGYSPKQYIMISRISYAKELLMTSDFAVTDISAKCGFGDVSNFIRSFRKETGITPNRYRKMSA